MLSEPIPELLSPLRRVSFLSWVTEVAAQVRLDREVVRRLNLNLNLRLSAVCFCGIERLGRLAWVAIGASR